MNDKTILQCAIEEHLGKLNTGLIVCKAQHYTFASILGDFFVHIDLSLINGEWVFSDYSVNSGLN
jgi:hypothetical protein